MNAEATSISTVLRAESLQKRFRSAQGEIAVLEEVSLSLAPRESLSIRGESGSGKTTLLNLLAALEVPDKGQVWWGEHPVAFDRATAARRGSFLGMVFQAYYLVPELNALENVLLAARVMKRPLQASRERAEGLLVELGLQDRLRSLPGQLSGGERQRVAVARALVNDPELVLADEPTGNLDERTGQRVMESLLQVCQEQGKALILVTHSREFAALTQRQLFLHGGRLGQEPGA